MSKSRSILGLSVALLLFFGACGGDDGPSLDEYAAALSAGIQADDDDDSIDIEPDEADCIGKATAEIIGLEALEEVGTPDEVEAETEDDLAVFDLSTAASLDVTDEYLDCVPSVFDQFIERVAEDDEALATCLEDELEVDDLRELIASSIRGDDEETAGETVDGAFAACQSETATGDDDLGDDLGDDDLGDDDGEAADFDAYLAAVSANILATDGVTIGITAEEADCIANTTLVTIGEERTTALGSPSEFVAATTTDFAAVGLDDDELAAIARGYLDCSAAAADGFRQVFNESAGSTPEQAACVDEFLTDDVIVELLVETLGGGDGQQFLADNQAAFEACA